MSVIQKTDPDGWIPWKNWKCPNDDFTALEVETICAPISKKMPERTRRLCYAGDLRFTRSGNGYYGPIERIDKFRLLAPVKPDAPLTITREGMERAMRKFAENYSIYEYPSNAQKKIIEEIIQAATGREVVVGS